MSILYLRDQAGEFVAVKTVNGKSAYEIALACGFEGTQEEWLESLKSTVVLTDKTLTKADQAADAEVTGAAIGNLTLSLMGTDEQAREAAKAAETAQSVANSAFTMARSAQTASTKAKSEASAASDLAADAKAMAADALQKAERVYVVPPEEGGTGKQTLAEALTALIASGPILLTAEHYGDALPEPGTPGRLFFKKVGS